MILSDFDLSNLIRSKRLIIRPFSKEIIRENGLDLRLADEIAVESDLGKDFVLDPSNAEHLKREYTLKKGQKMLVLPPMKHVLLSTVEHLELPDNLIGFVELRSTWARHGLLMPPTIIDAGFKGTITIEVYNTNAHGIGLPPNVGFAHVVFAATLNKVENAYKGFYSGQKGVQTPKAIKK